MAATCSRFCSTNRGPLSSIFSHVKPRGSTAAPRRSAASPAASAPASFFFGPRIRTRRFTSLSRCSTEVDCCWSMLPLHSSVAEARLRSWLSLEPRSRWALLRDGADGT